MINRLGLTALLAFVFACRSSTPAQHAKGSPSGQPWSFKH